MTRSRHNATPEHTCLACSDSRRPLAVVDVAGDDDLAQRLRAAGLWADAVVEIVGHALFGDPMLVELHGFRLALRRSEAERVTVRPVEPEA